MNFMLLFTPIQDLSVQAKLLQFFEVRDRKYLYDLCITEVVMDLS